MLKASGAFRTWVTRKKFPDMVNSTVAKIKILGRSVKVTLKSADGAETLNIPYQIQTVNAGSKVLAADEAGIEEKARNQSLLNPATGQAVQREVAINQIY